MAKTPEQPDPRQDALFGVEQSTQFGHTDPGTEPHLEATFVMPGDEVIHAGEDSADAVSIAETTDARVRAAHLIKSLDFLAGWNMRGGFRYASEAPRYRSGLQERYGGHLDDFSDEVAHNRSQLLQAARTEFKSAYEAGMGPTVPEDPQFRQGWRDFYTRYAGTPNRRALVAHRAGLKKLVALKGVRPQGNSYTLSESTEALPESELEELDKQAKLDIFKDDKRLQFYPATNREEEQGRRALNYLDEPHGIHSMLDEIAAKSYKDARKAGLSNTKARQAARIARTSVIHEWGSYVGDAKRQLGELQDLAEKLDGVNPNLTIREATEDDHSAFPVLVREHDLEIFHAKGKEALGFDPLLTREDRSPQTDPSRNKAVHDRYTTDTPEDMIQERILEWSNGTTVGALNRSKRLAILIARTRNRGRFWDSLLLSTEGADKRVAAQIREEHGLATPE